MRWPSLLRGLTIAMSNDDAFVIPDGAEHAPSWRIIRDAPSSERAEAKRFTVEFLEEHATS